MSSIPKSLSALLDGIAVIDRDVEVSSLTLDSREVQHGSCFVAVPGALADGRNFIDKAIASGACAVLAEANDYSVIECQVPVVLIDNLNAKLSEIASRFYQHPSKQIKVIGVTGTNGKTSVCFYIAQALSLLGEQAAVVGTIGYGKVDCLNYTGLTTPDAISVQKQLRELVDAGNTTICMEVSSHGLDQHRVASVEFDVAIFTNLSQDHLDYHGSMQAYEQAKAKLFKFPSLKNSVINIDDEFGVRLLQQITVSTMAYGWQNADVTLLEVSSHQERLNFKAKIKGEQYELATDLIGEFNATNLIAAIAGIVALGYQASAVVNTVPNLKAPPGRLEKIDADISKPTVIVDFAHTPDALEQALLTVRTYCEGKLSVVFGCGGDRDAVKRPLMGEIAEKHADHIVLTDDNPRGERPSAIVVDIMQGLRYPVTVLHNREDAIRSAVLRASGKDWVLIAGKGHEAEQVYADKTLEINDRDIALSALENWEELAA